MIIKMIWFLRGLLYKPFFGKYLLPSYIGKPIYIGGFKQIYIGKRVRILPQARIEAVNKASSITIKENVSIGQNLHIISGEHLVINKNCTLSANVFITNIDHEYKEIDKHILEQPLLIKKTTIGENCFIGYGAVIQAGTILGKQCVIGANAVVRGDFPDYSVIVGAPAIIIKRYNVANKEWEKTDINGSFYE